MIYSSSQFGNYLQQSRLLKRFNRFIINKLIKKYKAEEIKNEKKKKKQEKNEKREIKKSKEELKKNKSTSEKQKLVQVFLKRLQGGTLAEMVSKKMKVIDLKRLIYEKLAIPVNLQILKLNQKHLEEDSKTLEEYNIQKEDSIYVSTPLLGKFIS